MTVEIAVYDVTPFLQGVVPFGGSFLEDLLLRGDLTSAAQYELVFQYPRSGALGTIRGSFVLDNGVPESGRIREISLVYQSSVFQDWTGLNWRVSDVSAALDAVDSGDADAFERFLHAVDYLFRAVGNPFGLPYSVYATRGNDIIEADGQSTGLHGLDGDDTIFGGAGFDGAYGGDGFDRIFGGLDGDVLFGGARSDLIFGGEGQDEIRGGTGFDRLFGGDEARFGDHPLRHLGRQRRRHRHRRCVFPRAGPWPAGRRRPDGQGSVRRIRQRHPARGAGLRLHRA